MIPPALQLGMSGHQQNNGMQHYATNQNFYSVQSMMNQPQQASPSPLPTALEVKQDYSISSMNNHNNRLDQSAHNMSHN